MSDERAVGELAYLITGHIAATCCHKGGAYKTDNPKCECRAIAEGLIEDREKVLAILSNDEGAHVRR